MDIRTVIRGAAVTALLLGATAPAQDKKLGFELERLELNTGRGSLLSGDGELLVRGGLNVGLVGHYQHLPLVLQNGQGQLDRVRHRAGTVLGASYGVLPWLEVGAQLPVILWQRGDDPTRLGLPPLSTSGLGTPVLQARLGLLSQRQEHPLNLAVDLGAGLPLGSESALARDAGPRLRARVTVGRKWARLEPALDAGVLVRPAHPLSGNDPTRLVPELRLGATVAVTGPRLRGELAVRSAFSPDTRYASIELLGGARLALTPRWELFALGGPGLGAAPGTPTARVLLGLNFHMEPPPGLERLSEAIPQFRLEQETLTAQAAPSLPPGVTPVPTRELMPARNAFATAAPLFEGSVSFAPGQAELSADRSVLQTLVLVLRSLPGESVIVLEGHAGMEGGETQDRLLPLKRAQAVRNYLTEQGVSPEHLRVRIPETPAREPRVRVFVGSTSLAGDVP